MANLSIHSRPNVHMYQLWRDAVIQLYVRISNISIKPDSYNGHTILKVSFDGYDFVDDSIFKSDLHKEIYIAIRTNPKIVCVCKLNFINYCLEYDSRILTIAFEILPVREEDIDKSNLQRLFDTVIKDFSYTDYTSFYKGDTTMYANNLFYPDSISQTGNDGIELNPPNNDCIKLNISNVNVTAKELNSFVKDNPTMVKNMLFGTRLPAIRKVIYNDPATIIYWADDTKTVVKATYRDTFNKEDGLAHAIAKKYFECMGFEHPRSMFKTVVENAVDLSARTKDRLAKKEKIKLLKAANENSDGE